MTLDWDEIAPRRPEERFRIYRLRSGELELLATTPDPEGVGVTLCTLAGEGEWDSLDAVGVLDTNGQDDRPGTWVVNPYARGDSNAAR